MQVFVTFNIMYVETKVVLKSIPFYTKAHTPHKRHTPRLCGALTVVGKNLCVPCPLEVNGKGIRGLGGVAGKEAHTIQTMNIISRRQHFIAPCLSSHVGNVFGLRRVSVCFPSTRKLEVKAKRSVWFRPQN
jgi:hypothetical protein